MLTFSKIWCYPFFFKKVMESMVNFNFRSKPAFHCPPLVDPQTLPISKLELFMAIANDLQSLTIIVKICAERSWTRIWQPKVIITTVDIFDMFTSFGLLFQHIGSISGPRWLGGQEGHGYPYFFWNRTLSGMFSRKIAFLSLFKASKTFLALAFPESRRRPWILNWSKIRIRTNKINLKCISDRAKYDMYHIHLGLEK